MTVINGLMRDAAGVPLTGQARFTPTAVIRDGTILVPPTTVTIPITNGAVSPTNVRETGDGWRYTVELFAKVPRQAGAALQKIDTLTGVVIAGDTMPLSAVVSALPPIEPSLTDEMVTGGHVTDDGHLILTRMNAPDLDAGFVTPEAAVLTAANVTGARTIALADGAVHELTLTGNTTFTLTPPALADAAVTITLCLVQDATGGRVVTWPAGIRWPQGIVPVLATAASGESVVTLLWTPARGWRGFVSGQDLR